MIMINAETGFVIYVLVLLAALCALAIRELWRSSVHDWRVSEAQLARCDSCDYTFVVQRNEMFPRCPRCQTVCRVRRR